jgi:hypothetical protein
VLITGKAEERFGARRINLRIRKWEGVMIERFCGNLSITVSQANVCGCIECFFLPDRKSAVRRLWTTNVVESRPKKISQQGPSDREESLIRDKKKAK